MDFRLKNGLWNAFIYYLPQMKSHDSILRRVFGIFFSLQLDLFPRLPRLPEDDYQRRLFESQYKSEMKVYKANRDKIITILKDPFDELKWFEVYDFVEFVAELLKEEKIFENFAKSCNDVLKRENAGYKLFNDKIISITDEIELSEIEKTIENPIDGVKDHIKQALVLYSDRKNPDYRNSIKESISAVEAIAKILVGDKKTTLGRALEKLETSGIFLHTDLKNAFKKLYGYTSDAEGIRHALMDEPTLSNEDARFMLITCSAFINYLTEKAIKSGIKIQ